MILQIEETICGTNLSPKLDQSQRRICKRFVS
jgi:hypothetical protein